ncbi:MAG TPA: zinc-dependent metalloprotease [Ilumatobacteraceae bacterium]|nr:zinc-dependent metalloprotease [Ilumatobacteraceae bacterium]
MADDATPDQPEGRPDDFFSALPMFGDLAKALQNQGPLNWDAARQFAQLGATGGAAEPNVDPAARLAFADLTRIAWFHVADVIGSDAVAPDPQVVTRSQWASGTLDAYRHLFTEMATALGAGDDDQTPEVAGDPMMAMMAGLSKMMAPAMLGMAVGSMVGHLATRAFGTHDLPIPRRPNSVTLLPSNIDGFATEWEIPQDEMRLWVLAHELAGHALFEADHLRESLSDLVRQHVGGFRPDPNAVAERLGSLDADATDPMAALQQALGDPEVLLGAVTSPAQLELRPRLDALVAVVVGYTDWIVDAVAVRVVGGSALRIAEAVRRRRVETTASDSFVEQLLGIRLGESQVARGKAFVQGVVDRAGDRGLRPLLERADAIPTPSEVDAPGLWLARIEP